MPPIALPPSFSPTSLMCFIHQPVPPLLSIPSHCRLLFLVIIYKLIFNNNKPAQPNSFFFFFLLFSHKHNLHPSSIFSIFLIFSQAQPAAPSPISFLSVFFNFLIFSQVQPASLFSLTRYLSFSFLFPSCRCIPPSSLFIPLLSQLPQL